MGLAELADAQSLAVTCNFSSVDTGLVQEDTDVDVRCELLAVARAPQPVVAAAVVAAADLLETARGAVPAQPGVLLPDLARFGGGLLADVADISVRHGLLIAPYLWGGPSPQLTEEGQLTLVLQLLMLTDSEYAYALEEGIPAVQQAVAEQGIDLLDWTRKDV